MLLSEAIRSKRVCRCPCCGFCTGIIAIIVHLETVHFWHRGNIADWVAEQEKLLGITETANVE